MEIAKLKFLFYFCTVLTLSSGICGFNINLKNSTVIKQKENQNNSEQSNFFGFDFALYLNKSNTPNTAKILVGSPKYSPYNTTLPGSDSLNNLASGSIYSCPITPPDDSGCGIVSPDSKNVDDNIITDSGSLGLSIIKGRNRNPDTGSDIMTCAPLRSRNCSDSYLTQGGCYGSQSFGESWTKDTKEAQSTCPTESVDLMFVLDGSGSVNVDDPQNFNRVKNWVKDVAYTFDMNGPARVGVVQYSHWYRNRDEQQYIQTEVELGEFKSMQLFSAAVDKIEIQGFTTYTAHAINKTVEDFKGSDRFNNSNTRKVMILLTDGRSNDRRMLPYSAAYARSQGITMFAIGVGGYSKDELSIIAGSEGRVYGLENFSDLNKIVDSLQTSITGILEGGINSNDSNGLQNAQTGMSGILGETIKIWILPVTWHLEISYFILNQETLE